MSPARNEQLSFDEIFSGQIPSTVGPLFFALDQINDTLNAPLEELVRVIYDAFRREVRDAPRQEVFRHMVQQVERGELHPKALLAVVRFETNHVLVSKAVAAFLRLKPSSFEEPFLAVRMVLDLIQGALVANRGAAFAGLVYFGDRRACAVARAIRGKIELEDARGFSGAATGPLQRPTIEFCIEWLLDLMSKEQYEFAIQVAYALSSMVIDDATLVVHDRQFNFGPYGFALARRDLTTSYKDLIDDLSRIVEVLPEEPSPAISKIVDFLKDPTSETIDRRNVADRRTNPERRASDRRPTSIAPQLERRSSQRRMGDRRSSQRR